MVPSTIYSDIVYVIVKEAPLAPPNVNDSIPAGLAGSSSDKVSLAPDTLNATYFYRLSSSKVKVFLFYELANLKYFDSIPSVVKAPVTSTDDIGIQVVKSIKIGKLYPPSGIS